MKKTILFALAAALFFLISCCKSYCISNNLYLRFINYSAAEIDTLLFTGYAPNGQFNQQQTSFYKYVNTFSADTIYIPGTENITPDKDWKISLISTGREYRITGIVTQNEKCQCSNQKVAVVKSHLLDGVVKNGDLIQLVK
jgi:hypothetical protein